MLINAQQLVDIVINPALAIDLSEAKQSDLVLILRHQKILARFAYFCEHAHVLEKLHPKTQRHLKNAMKIAEKQREQVVLEASEITNTLNAVSDFVVFLKGAAYTLSNKRVGLGRVYSDIDILVNKSQLKACEQTLAIQGWLGQEINDYDDKYYRKWAHEIPPLAHGSRGTIIDVHHNIIPIISKNAPTVADLAEHIETNDNGIQVLSPAAQYVHSAVHLFRSEDYSNAFRDVIDLFLMISDSELQTDVFNAEFENDTSNSFTASENTSKELIEDQDPQEKLENTSQADQSLSTRALTDKELSNKELKEVFIDEVVKVAKKLGFEYEVGLSFAILNRTFGQHISASLIEKRVGQRKVLFAFDKWVFGRVLLPQHRFLPMSISPIRNFLAVMRGHMVKMPLHILIYHLTVKSGRGIAEAVLGKHIFTPSDNAENMPAHFNKKQ